jgi:hypothetical protein
MICSEVQRTLVKSPPELWAEISDPDSLARHLGEFGEIRITRVEPEQRVEWEAGDTSGSVIIKPSGWGTKVKLTVTRELAESEADGDAQDAPAADGPAEPAVDWSGEGEPSGDGPSEPSAPEADAEPGLESGDDAAFPDDEPALLEDEPGLLEEDEPEVLDDEPGLLDEAQPARAGEAADAAAVAELDAQSQTGRQPAPAPRQGFFARLFGRRRGAPALEPPVTDEPARQFAAEIVQEERPAPAPYNALAVWASQMHPTDGADEQLPRELAEPSPPRQAADGDAGQTPQDELPSELGDSRATLPEGSETPGDAARDDTPAADGEPVDSTAAEEVAAEELAAEEVTTVLTGVLDRLGAAHHRPFSRG